MGKKSKKSNSSSVSTSTTTTTTSSSSTGSQQNPAPPIPLKVTTKAAVKEIANIPLKPSTKTMLAVLKSTKIKSKPGRKKKANQSHHHLTTNQIMEVKMNLKFINPLLDP